MNTLLVLGHDESLYVSELKKRKFPKPSIHSAQNPEAAAHYIEQADIILGRPADAALVLDKAKKLRWLQSTFAGNTLKYVVDFENSY